MANRNRGSFLHARKTSLIEASKKVIKTKQEYDRLAKGIADLENTIGSAKVKLATMQKNAAETELRASGLLGKAREAVEGQLLQLNRSIAMQKRSLAEMMRKLVRGQQDLVKKEKELTKDQKAVVDKQEKVADAERDVANDRAEERKDFETYNDRLQDLLSSLDGIDDDIAEKLRKKEVDPEKKLKEELKKVNKEVKDLNKGFVRKWASNKIDDFIGSFRVVKAFKWIKEKREGRKERLEALEEAKIRKEQLEATGKLRVAIEKELKQRQEDAKEKARIERTQSGDFVADLRKRGAKAVAEAYANIENIVAADITKRKAEAAHDETLQDALGKGTSGGSSKAGGKSSTSTRTETRTTGVPSDTIAETQLNKNLLEREVDALEKIAKAAEAGISGKGKDGKGNGKSGMGLADWKADWDIGKKLLPLLGRVAIGAASVAAAGYGAYRAYGELKNLWTGEDANGKKLDEFDKAKSVANLAVQGALTTIGFALGGPQGAALAAGLTPLLMDGVNAFGNMLAESSIGPIIGRGIAIVLNPLEELPKLWKDQAKFIEEGIGKIAAMAASFIKPAKDAVAGAYNKAVAVGANAIEATVNTAKSVGSAASSAWDKAKAVVSGTAKEAPGTVQRAAESAGKIAVQAAAPVAAAASSVGSAIGTGVSAAAETVKKGYTSISEAAGKLFRPAAGVDMEGLQPAVKQNFLGMAQDYKDATGKILPVNSGFRSFEKQQAEYKKDPNRAAKPGTSTHERGISVDTNSADGNKLESLGLLAKWGFSRPAKTKKGQPELWHLQATGTAQKAAELGYNNGDYQSTTTISGVSNVAEAGAAPATARKGATTKVVQEQLAPEMPAAKQKTDTSRFGNVSPAASGPANNSPKMSAESIPIFSYADPTFFALNLSALA